MHYPRIPRAYWRDRFKKAKALGLNAITTYVFWNVHEPKPGQFDFSGNSDVAEFVKEAGEEGLYVILRPGPYVCAEWEWGGYPWWLAHIPGMEVRSFTPPFMEKAERYLKELGKRLAPLQVGHGGPILMVQVENEYGSFGKDHAYMGRIRDTLREAGFDGQLYTADGASNSMLGGGTLPELPAAINFGGGAEGQFANLAKFRPNSPRMNGEFWCGWFDHWGEEHHTTSVPQQTADLTWMLDRNISFSLYMFDGGTSFGWMNGANSGGKDFEPDTTSYDYDSPVSEQGRITPKYRAFREAIAAHLPAGTELPPIPIDPPSTVVDKFELTDTASVFDQLPKPIKADKPLTMEALGQGYGFVLYRTRPAAAYSAELKLQGLQDRAQVYVNGIAAGVIERRLGQNRLTVDVPEGATLDILVENQGRINYSHALVNEHKGIAGATLAGRELIGWEMFRLPFDHPGSYRYLLGSAAHTPTLYRGTFNLREVADTNLDLRGWGHGNVWVNGHNLGRFWGIGPQRSLFLPAPWLHKGRNEVIVLDTQPTGTLSLSGVKDPIFGNGGH